jgi:hypothetical protein
VPIVCFFKNYFYGHASCFVSFNFGEDDVMWEWVVR